MRWILGVVLIALCMVIVACSYAEVDITPIIGYVLTQPRVAEMSDGNVNPSIRERSRSSV